MPKYQYQCKDCGESLEVQQSFTDDALTVCPNCGGDLRKVFNAVGVVFKGSGFYRTDSRSGSTATDAPAAKTETKSETKSDSKSDSKSEAKSDSKPAAKPAASTTSSSSSD